METTLPKMLQRVAQEHPGIPAQYYKNTQGEFQSISFKELFTTVLTFAGGLKAIDIQRFDHIGLIADNRKEWFQSDMGLLSIGAIDVPRGCDASENELGYILAFAECKTSIVENDSQVKKMLSLKKAGLVPLLKTLIVFDPIPVALHTEALQAGFMIYTHADIIAKGELYRKEHPNRVETELEKGERTDLACIIFTSGTTGEPKGVMLSHGNFLHQLDELPERIIITPGDKALCVLPVWHSFERMCEYVMTNGGAALCYSKPIGSVLLADFRTLNPQILPAVPRVFEAIYEGIYRTMRKTGGAVYALFSFFVGVALIQSKIDRKLKKQNPRFKKENDFLNKLFLTVPWLLLTSIKALGSVLVFKKIRAKLGTDFHGGISGGGALPPAVDEFFWAIGVTIVEGYGLTETAPVVAVRPFTKPVFGTIGTPIRGTEVKIVDDNGTELPTGVKGTVLIRGGQVMQGYYKKPELTASVISNDGWFNSGDIGMKTINGEITLRGRKKDTIVLRGGENVEPLPIEMRLNESRYILQATLVGQDQRYLAALIVPNQEEVLGYAKENNIDYESYADLLHNNDIKRLFESEIAQLINAKSGFKMFERIQKFALLEKSFEVGRELSAKQEVMRYKLLDIYEKEIKSFFN